MMKPGVVIEIPRFGTREIHTVVSDYTGTLSRGGKVTPGVREKLATLLDLVDIREELRRCVRTSPDSGR